MAEKIKVEETKDVVEFFTGILNWISSAGDGSFGVMDILSLAPCLTDLRDAIDGIGKVPGELADMSEKEKKELILFVRKELDLVDDEREGLAEFATQLVLELIRFYAWYNGKK